MVKFEHKDVYVDAMGRGGIETCYILQRYQLAFDAGRCPYALVDIPRLFVTHAHLDHAAGIPYYISQRSLRHLPPPEIYCPHEIVDTLQDILRLWQKLEGYEYPLSIRGLEVGSRIEVRKDMYVRALRSFHRVPSRGYALMRQSRKLKEEFLSLPGKEIQRMKEQDKKIFEDRDIPLFVFSGDSTIEFLTENSEAREATVLFLECTYIDDKRPVAKAREWGHIHLDEVIENRALFQNEKIVLTHFSRRYTKRFIAQVLKRKIQDEEFLSRLFILAHED